MELINQIIEILSSENPSLENALIKTKVLLHKLGEKDSIEWVNREINGYADTDEIPEYRVISSRPMVTATDGYSRRWNDMPAVTGHLTEKQIHSLTVTEMRNSISGLEHLASGEGNTLSNPISPEFWPKLSEGLSSGIQVEYAHCEIAKSQVLQINTVIRSRLLDFVLELDGKVPGDASPEDIKALSKQIGAGSLLNNAMFGDNTTIILGDHNTQTVNNSIVQNDLDSLINYLKKNEVPEEDTKELISCIEADNGEVDMSAKQTGPAVSNWIKTMLGKAVDTTWKIKIGAAGSLLASAIGKFYGF